MTNIAFFYQQAGYSYPTGSTPAQQRAHRLNGARRLASAERWAESQGLEVVWEQDECSHVDDWEFPEDRAIFVRNGAVCARLVRPCEDHGTDCRHAETLASLGGILESADYRDARDYRRIVAAELALEAR